MSLVKTTKGKGLVDRFTRKQQKLAEQISNDISEDIDNDWTREQLMMAVAYYADLACDAWQKIATKTEVSNIGFSREDIIAAIRQGHKEYCRLMAKEEGCCAINFPDFERMIDHIAEHGIPHPNHAEIIRCLEMMRTICDREKKNFKPIGRDGHLVALSGLACQVIECLGEKPATVDVEAK